MNKKAIISVCAAVAALIIALGVFIAVKNSKNNNEQDKSALTASSEVQSSTSETGSSEESDSTVSDTQDSEEKKNENVTEKKKQADDSTEKKTESKSKNEAATSAVKKKEEPSRSKSKITWIYNNEGRVSGAKIIVWGSYKIVGNSNGVAAYSNIDENNGTLNHTDYIFNIVDGSLTSIEQLFDSNDDQSEATFVDEVTTASCCSYEIKDDHVDILVSFNNMISSGNGEIKLGLNEGTFITEDGKNSPLCDWIKFVEE